MTFGPEGVTLRVSAGNIIARLINLLPENNMSPRIAVSRLRSQLPAGMVVRLTEDNEYRVNFKAGKEATAYYTDDADDALGTARAMSRRAVRAAALDKALERIKGDDTLAEFFPMESN